jgi:hypothetical protein
MKEPISNIKDGYNLLHIVILLRQPAEADRPENGWFEFVIPDLDSSASVVDMSFLNRNAGKAGYIL